MGRYGTIVVLYIDLICWGLQHICGHFLYDAGWNELFMAGRTWYREQSLKPVLRSWLTFAVVYRHIWTELGNAGRLTSHCFLAHGLPLQQQYFEDKELTVVLEWNVLTEHHTMTNTTFSTLDISVKTSCLVHHFQLAHQQLMFVHSKNNTYPNLFWSWEPPW